jgi:hypothetical protein
MCGWCPPTRPSRNRLTLREIYNRLFPALNDFGTFADNGYKRSRLSHMTHNLQFACDTLRSRGYHMSEEDGKELEDKAIIRHVRAKQQLTKAKQRLDEIAAQIETVARRVKSSDAEEVAGFSFGPFEWLKPEEITLRAKDVVLARAELSAAQRNAVSLGAPID